MASKIAIYPGTFDPVTFGHMDIIRRGTHVVDHVIVGVAADSGKDAIFSMKDRVAMVKGEVAKLPESYRQKISVKPFSGLLVRFATEENAGLLLRGMRATSDFEYEFQMACMNHRLNAELETVFLTASETMQFVSSRFVKQICRLGGDISSFTSPEVARKLAAYYATMERKTNHESVS
jgi:pantetheine-phosphate adenylyltransferase